MICDKCRNVVRVYPCKFCGNKGWYHNKESVDDEGNP